MSTAHSAHSGIRFFRSTATLLCLSLLLRIPLAAQAPAADEVRSFIKKLDSGQTDEVRRALPNLITKYQNTPELLYLQGRMASDGIEAVKFYQSVVDNFPKSGYADDALFRMYQYYYALGLYRTAEKKLAQLKNDYPNSPFIPGASPMALPKQEEAAIKLPEKEPAIADTPAAAVADTPVPAAADTHVPAATDTHVPAPVKTAPQNPKKPYTLQVGAFSTLANAEKQKGFFEQLGYAAEIADKVRSGRSLHLVWVGSFANADEALHSAKEIRSKYKIDSIVLEKY